MRLPGIAEACWVADLPQTRHPRYEQSDRTDVAVIDGMFIAVDAPSHSIRIGRDTAGTLLIVLDPSFTTGNDGDIAKRFVELEQWVRANIPAGEVVWRWVNEDYDSPDRVPYVGELKRRAAGMYVATGFNGWGSAMARQQRC
jgi:glycine/D-amino acid oxidase-like deaminating enzyme